MTVTAEPVRLVVDIEGFNDPDLQLIVIGRPGQDFNAILQDALRIPYDGALLCGQPRPGRPEPDDDHHARR